MCIRDSNKAFGEEIPDSFASAFVGQPSGLRNRYPFHLPDASSQRHSANVATELAKQSVRWNSILTHALTPEELGDMIVK